MRLNSPLSRCCSFVVAGLSVFSVLDARPPKNMALPDFTKGDVIPEGANHDWNLGATGARGWIYTDKLVTTDARQIKVTAVAKGSPADGVLEEGDVILGVAGKPFSFDPRTEFGHALTKAESVAGKGELSLEVWRDGKQGVKLIKLPVLGSYSETAPYGCSKSSKILVRGCASLAERMKDPGYKENPITRSLNAIGLLASGDPSYLPLVKREAEWASGYSAGAMQTWYYGYVIMLLAEYTMATGDESFLPGLKRLAMEAATGQSIVGSWGHRFANPDGRLGGYGMMNAPGLPLTTSLIMARAAGVKDPAIDRAIERSARLLRFYIGKGAVPYGDHSPWTETHEDNGKCGMAAVMFNFMKEKEGAKYFSRMSVASHGGERDGGHTGNFWNVLWSMPAVAQSGPNATGAWMKEFGAWYFDLARRWDGSFAHLGPPQPANDSYANWDASGSYLIAYAMPLKKIWLTGKQSSIAPQLNAEEALSLILDGRGWHNKDRHKAYDALTGDQLFESLTSWSPIVRERAAAALARRKEVPVKPLIQYLEEGSLYARLGACEALIALRGRGASAIPALQASLKSDDLWLRVKAATALASMGEAASGAVPQLLELLAEVDTDKDPRGMQQRYLSEVLFSPRRGMLGRSLDGVDRAALYRAVKAGLLNEDGRARGNYASVYENLSFEELRPLLPAIHQAIVEPAPSGVMFASGIRVAGLKLLAKHKVEEGMEACVDYILKQNPWASEKRTPGLLEILLSYGANAKPLIPELEKVAATFDKGEPNFPKRLSEDKARMIREAIQTIENSTEKPELIRLK